MADKCNAGCGRAVVYRWLRDDGDGFELCEHHSAVSAKTLTDLGYDMWLTADEATTHG